MLNWLSYITPVIGLALIVAMVLDKPYSVTIINYHYDLSENVEVFTTIPKRVISTNGSATELLLSLGLEDHMIGTAYLDNPPLPEHMEAYSKIPILSRQYPGKELVLYQEPDLIVGWLSVFSSQFLGDPSYWNNLGVSTFILRDSAGLEKKISNIYNDLEDIGKIFQVEDRANAKIQEIQTEFSLLRNKALKREKKLRVLLLECLPGYRLRVWGDESTPGQMLLAIGAENVFHKTGDQNRESIVSANPDAIIFIYMDSTLEETIRQMNDFRTDNILKYTNASRDNRMGLVPLSETYCPGVRIIMGIRHMSEILFPEEELA